MLDTLAVQNYRSLRDLVLPLDRLTVVTGANGTGKSNLYRALRLIAETAHGGVVPALAAEGGLQSALWAGAELVREPVALRLGYGGDEFGYSLELGLPPQSPGDPSYFRLDPHIKRECVWAGPTYRKSTVLADRHKESVHLRDESGAWAGGRDRIRIGEGMLGEYADPRRSPELLLARERIRSWRFYDQLRTDPLAPARGLHVGTFTPVLAGDGADLAPATATIIEVGDRRELATAVDNAFPGSTLDIADHAGRFELLLHQPGLRRPVSAAELSDGTLRYLLLVAALLTPRPPELMVLNEPETSLHNELLPALGALIAAAAERLQLVVVSHAGPLVAAIEAAAAERSATAARIELVKQDGRTVVAGQGALDRPPWHWPPR